MNSKKLIYLFVVLFFFFGVNFAYFQTQNETTENQQQSDVNQTTSPTSLTNPLGSDSPEVLIGNVINTVFGIVGSLALLMFIYGGLTWMTSAGNKEAVDKGKRIITWAAIGLVIIFTSYALVRFLIVGVGAA